MSAECKIKPSDTIEPPGKLDFFSFPPEIRNAIYFFLVIHPEPIRIRSLRTQHQLRKIANRSNFAQVLCVNRQMHSEASTIFYASNTFVVGNGPWGARSLTNLRALRDFIKRVPATHLASIGSVSLEIHVRHYWDGVYRFGHDFDAKAVHSIISALTKHFKGLESVTFRVSKPGHPWATTSGGLLLSDAKVDVEFTRVLSDLLKNRRILRIETCKDEFFDMSRAVEATLKVTPGAASILMYPSNSG